MKILSVTAISVLFLFAAVLEIRTENLMLLGKSQARTISSNDNPTDFDCSDGWRITGYFTPVEDEYTSPETKEIEIEGVGKMTFNAEFLNIIFSDDEGFGEGWGKTRFGWYLGNYSGGWHKSDAPLDAHNKALDPNSVAVDNRFIPNNSSVEIPALPGEFGKKIFTADDVGVSVHGKHIDVYCGEGKAAGRKMYRVTFEDDNVTKVCFKKP